MELSITDYLDKVANLNNKGKCKSCIKLVFWSRRDLAQHKRKSCTNISTEERNEFAKKVKPAETSNETSIESNDSDRSLTVATKIEIDEAFARVFYRTGIAFRIADSHALRDFIKLINPEYEKVMPSAKVVSGSLLNNQFIKAQDKVNLIIGRKKDLILISDGWTNNRGEHIVNFLLKAPGEKSVFYKSIITNGITQDGEAVANDIGDIIEEVGPEKFCGVITDNAPVMKRSWKLLEERYPHIAAFGCAAHCLNLFIQDLLKPHLSGNNLIIID